MANAQTQKVLDRIDADFDNSLQRLFALLRIIDFGRPGLCR